ncbi:MAG: hypothetical protein M1495_02545 [Bacteroidetes bacterium]|nr:hypothetical protein [Bacteroidota bacterium]
MTKSRTRILSYIIFFITSLTFAQIKVTSLPTNMNGVFDAQFYDQNEIRNVTLLNSGWYVYYENDPQKKVETTIPAIFEGEESLVFEKGISFTSDEVKNKQLRLGFLGLNYSAEILVNGYSIYKHQGGSYPFEVVLPNDILKENANNTISVKVNRKLNSENTIPVEQRFLFPVYDGGIIRDVYLKSVSLFHFSQLRYDYTLDQNLSKAYLNFKVNVENSAYKSDQTNTSKEFLVRINLFAKGSATPQVKGDFVQTTNTEIHESNIQLELPNPQLWSPDAPNSYTCEVSLLENGIVVDKTIRQISFYQLKKSESGLLLNGNPFALKGTTYFLNETALRKTTSYQKLKDDLSLIKSTGFNSVRFAKCYPNPYALQLCRDMGLFALIELPINSVPEDILSKNDFDLSAEHSLKEFINIYSKYSTAVMFGVGSSFLPNSEITEDFVSKLGKVVEDNNFLSYASFVGIQKSKIDGIDFIGLELLSVPISRIKDEIDSTGGNFADPSLFISELTYPNYKGGASGYLTKFSTEAQAKYFGDFINFAKDISLPGFFINSLYEYRGAFPSLYSGYSSDGLYKLGVLDNYRNLNDIAYKVIASKLTTNEKVTIPIGAAKDDSPLSFILFALALAIVLAVLINTKKKFREDCTRALLRPYNFFADIRDNRILSGIHTIIMMLIEAGAGSLLFTILLYFLKSSILLDKIFLSFGSATLMKVVSYLAWNPQSCFLILFFVFIAKFVLLSLAIKLASFFIKTRVEIFSIFYTVTWSFLPFTLLLPIELVLYKILIAGSINIVIFIFLIIYFLWILQRMLKGIYVIFDVRPGSVYFYFLLVIVVILGGVVLKFQLSHSTLYYIGNAIKQYKSMIF